MLPYLTPMQIRLEKERQDKTSMFPPMNAGIRAELEARLYEESDMLLAQPEQPAHRFSLRALLLGLPRLSFLKLQRSLK